MSWIDTLLEWDKDAFWAIHQSWSNPFFDAVLPWLREPLFWIPVYIFLIFFSVKNYKRPESYRDGLLWVLAVILVFAITDFTSASILKPFFARVRPCNEESFQPFIHHLVRCGSGKSFPSSHSSNHWGLSFFIIFTLGKYKRWIKYAAVIWAFLVVLAQVYVGVHYPLDILGGFVLGYLAAVLISFVFHKFVPHNL